MMQYMLGERYHDRGEDDRGDRSEQLAEEDLKESISLDNS